MRPLPLLAALSVATLAAGAARADDEVPANFPKLVLDDGRPPAAVPEPDAYKFTAHGELELRYQAQRSFYLDPTASAINAKPGLVADSIGQNPFFNYWIRVTPRLLIRENVEVVGQLDLGGVLFGDRAHDTGADETPRDSYDGFSNLQPRWLYVQYTLPVGLVRVGQQPNHWGMGILANDGDHPSLFGDYRYGSISERVLFATKPGGKNSDFFVALAGDLVYRDQTAKLTDGDHAFQGVLAAFWQKHEDQIGLFTTLRHQENARTSGSSIFSYTDTLDALALDLHGKFVSPLAGQDAYVFGEAEAAYVFGSTNDLRTNEQAATGQKTDIRSYGGAAQIGVVHRAVAAPEGEGDAKGLPFGDVVGQLEVGYASGDADPLDTTARRFTFDPNHHVGLILFDEVMRWQTARAATAAKDPLLTNAARPTPGVDLLPSNGGVFGAEYVNPTFIVRPRRWLDLKGGMVVAQSTSEVVDPYRLATQGSYVNYRGGDRRKKDLGLELDTGFESRMKLEYVEATVGAQAGLLFPGGAFDDANGIGMPTQWIAIGRFGIQF